MIKINVYGVITDGHCATLISTASELTSIPIGFIHLSFKSSVESCKWQAAVMLITKHLGRDWHILPA